MSIQDRIKNEIDRLKAMGDELDIQAHLAKAEAKDELHSVWKKAEHARAQLEAEYDRVKAGADESLENVGEAADLLIGEIKNSYQKIKDLI